MSDRDPVKSCRLMKASAKPEETAQRQDGELIFPMTKWNYRMIAVTDPPDPM